MHEGNRIFEQLTECIVINSDIKEVNDMGQAVDGILSGEALLFIDGENKALVIGVKAPQGRQVEPDTEASIEARGRLCCVSSTNMFLFENPNLKMEMMQLGKQTKTDAICYIKGIANEEIVREVRERLKKSRPMPYLIQVLLSSSFPTADYPFFPRWGTAKNATSWPESYWRGV